MDRCEVYNQAGDVLYDSEKDQGSCLPAVEKAQHSISPLQKAINASEWAWIHARALNRQDNHERMAAIERHLIKAHGDLRDDPEATRIYDEHAMPGIKMMSQTWASYRGSGAEKLNQTLTQIRSIGMSAASFEKVITGFKEKLASNIKESRNEGKIQRPDDPPKERNR